MPSTEAPMPPFIEIPLLCELLQTKEPMVFYWHCPITKAFLFLQASGPTRYPFSLREQTRKTNGAYICEVTEREHKNIHNGKT